jgi:hypothetical protein
MTPGYDLELECAAESILASSGGVSADTDIRGYMERVLALQALSITQQKILDDAAAAGSADSNICSSESKACSAQSVTCGDVTSQVW